MKRSATAALAALLAIGSSAGVRAASPSGPVVELPPFVVTGIQEGLPWKYGRAGNFEVLSLCSDSLTRRFVASLHRGTFFLPDFVQVRWSRPVQVILFDEKNAALKAVTATPATSRLGPGAYDLNGTVAVSDHDSLVIAANLHGRWEWPAFTTVYAVRGVAELAPPLPSWLEAGLIGKHGVYSELAANLRRGACALPSLEWEPKEEAIRLLRDGKFQPALVPLGELFSWRADSGSIAAGARDRRCAVAAALFIRWALYGRKETDGNAQAFWRFARAACRGPVAEAAFVQCFHLDYATAENQLRAYLRRAIRSRVYFSAPMLDRVLPEYDHLALRPATEAEIARIKGNWERLEAHDLQPDFPDLARRYRENAGRTLRRGRKLGGENDSALLAVLGLHEYEQGDLAAARLHLERAAADSAGSQALLALARIRLADARRQPAPGGRLTPAQASHALAPLLAARSRSPAVPEVYELIAEICAQSQATPARDDLAVLREGTRLFPGNARLIARVADLYLRAGDAAEASALATAGLKFATDAALRRHLAGLQAPPHPPAAAAPPLTARPDPGVDAGATR